MKINIKDKKKIKQILKTLLIVILTVFGVTTLNGKSVDEEVDRLSNSLTNCVEQIGEQITIDNVNDCIETSKDTYNTVLDALEQVE